jgi:hypothetical protein
MGVYKVDWALDGPIPWRNPACALAGTVHLGGTLEGVALMELGTIRSVNGMDACRIGTAFRGN